MFHASQDPNNDLKSCRKRWRKLELLKKEETTGRTKARTKCLVLNSNGMFYYQVIIWSPRVYRCTWKLDIHSQTNIPSTVWQARYRNLNYHCLYTLSSYIIQQILAVKFTYCVVHVHYFVSTSINLLLY